ncbi:cell wall hydrolase, partial [Patescibacteria group bacterium]|nr:cell wall hydrolase [Patescibacteria group bacterium]
YKTVLIAVNLKSGNHNIILKPNQSPYIKSISVSKVEEKDKIIYIPVDNNPAQKSEGRPWLSYIILDLFITNLSITARTKKSRRDDDDIKLLINGEIEKNENKRAHRNWYWCGKISKGKEEIFSKEINTQIKQFNLDLYSDETPRLSSIEIGVKKTEDVKRIPTVDDPLWTGDFRDDTEEMLLARAIFGEGRSLSDKGKTAIAWSIKNRVEDSRWPNNYYDVILQKSQFSAFRKSDANWEYVKDPFYKINSKQLTAWEKCYEIARLVISGEIKDFTGGVNHYFSDYIDYPSWTKSKSAKFIMKIGNTLFYNLKNESNGGFVKIKYLIILLSLLALFVFGYLIVKNEWFIENNEAVYNDEVGEKFYHLYINPQTDEIEKLIFKEDGEMIGITQITNNGYLKSHLLLFSNEGPAFGYYQNLHKLNEVFDYNDDGEREKYYDNYTALMIDKNDGFGPFEVYRGSYHTSFWEWEDNKHVKVYLSCGTCCRYYYLININTLEIEEKGHLEEEEDACIQGC